MSAILQSLQELFKEVWSELVDLSERSPGSTTTQMLVLGGVLAFLTYTLSRKRYKLPPGPPALPLLGNIFLMKDQKEAFYIKLQKMAAEKYGPVITFYLGPTRCVSLNSIEVINEALVQRGADFAGRPYLYSLQTFTEGGKSLIISDPSPAWKQHRKIALQAIRRYLMGAQLERVVQQEVAKTADLMLNEKTAFDPHTHIAFLMFNIIDKIAFSDCKARDVEPPEDFLKIFDDFEKNGNDFLEDVIPLLRLWPTRKFQNGLQLFRRASAYCDKNVAAHRKSFDPNHIRDLTDSILLTQSEAAREAQNEAESALYSDELVGSTIKDVYLAAIGTSRDTLLWALLFIAGHPKVQKRMQTEIDSAVGKRLPGFGDKAKLAYSEATLYEVMRIAASVPTAIPHKALCDTTVAGYDVPKDTMVMVNLWAAMHDPRVWKDPEHFVPERFLDDKGQMAKRPESWLPFSTGRRSCIGETVVKPELLLILACFLQRFSVSLPPDVECKATYKPFAIGTNPARPYKITVTPR